MNTQEQKDLLLKDLCARLPYGVKVNENIQGVFTLIGLTTERVFTTCEVESCYNDFPIENIKPYLFPLSSMTEEQKKELDETLVDLNLKALSDKISSEVVSTYEIDFYNKNHFDYRGIIEKSLALDATGLGIY